MQLLLSASLFLLIVGMATATPGPTMDQLIVVQASPTPGASTWEGFVPSTTMLTDPVSSPTQAPTSYLVLREAVAPVVAPVPVLDDAPASLPAIVPIRPPILPSTLSPTADLVSSPTMEPTITSEFPSLVPSFSSLPTIEPSVAPAEDPTKRPTSGNFISSVKVIGLEMSLRNAGTLLETNRWQVETEKFYNEYFEDIICVVSFVKSQASDLNDPRVNTITYDLLLQSEFMRITDSTRYALAPFQDPAANIQYGNALRKLINFERLSLPIPVPKAPKRTDVGSEEKRYIYGKLGMHALLGIVAAGLFGVFIAVYGYNRASRQRRLSKPSTEPTSTFRISSDDDISTIGPADDCMDSEKGESESTADDDRPKRFGGRVFGRMVLGKMGRKMCMGGSAIAESRDDDENECPEGDLMDVFVPPGKLGIIIDTPDDGPPTVHVVKETSAVRDRIHVGDKLIAVDDEDVQEMTATQVSKIISNKSFNSQRKFTIVRPYDVINI